MVKDMMQEYFFILTRIMFYNIYLGNNLNFLNRWPKSPLNFWQAAWLNPKTFFFVNIVWLLVQISHMTLLGKYCGCIQWFQIWREFKKHKSTENWLLMCVINKLIAKQPTTLTVLIEIQILANFLAIELRVFDQKGGNKHV